MIWGSRQQEPGGDLLKLNEYSLVSHAWNSLRLAALLSTAALILASGCSSTPRNPPNCGMPCNSPAAKNAGNFTTTVFLGDSLTAGYQSGSLLDTQQVHGWAPLVAQQAGFQIVLPLIAAPGAPAVLKLVSLGPPPVIVPSSGTTTGRDNFTIQATDLAVPGAEVNDVMNTVPLAVPTTGQQIITQLVLGFPGLGYGQAYSQSKFAIIANPTTIFLWIGNNDALIADITGMSSSMTSVADFTTQYQALITQLTGLTSAHLVIANIPDVTLVPYLTPAPLVLAETSFVTHLPTAVLSALLGIQAGDFVNPTGLSEIPLILTGKQKGPIDDAGVLSAAEAAEVKARVIAYNQVIAAQAAAIGATTVDINALFAQAAANGIVINGYTANSSFLGGIFALDGIHPTNTGYAVLANKFIDSLNAQNGTKIPDINLSTIAAADPFFTPNLVPHLQPGATPHITPAAGKTVDKILLPARLAKQF